jgi:hypothetical protein
VNSAGDAIDGAHGLRLSLYATPSSTTALHTETHANVPVSAGDFLVYLGENAALPLSLFRDNAELWLEVVIDGSEIIQPRFRLATAPYAGLAQYCGDSRTLAGNQASAFALAGHDHDAQYAALNHNHDALYAALGHTHAFSSLTGIPAGLSDGDNDSFASLTCAANQVVQRGANAWGCLSLAPVATSGSFADLSGVPAGLLSGTGTAGYLPRYSAAATLATSSIFQDGAGRIGIGTTSPGGTFHVNGPILWGNSLLSNDQGGSIELGDSGRSGTVPFIDFHYGVGGSQDYNVRLHNAASGQLWIYADTLRAFPTTAVSMNVAFGYAGNGAIDGVIGSTISGGGSGQLAYGANVVADNFGTIAGGANNRAGDNAGTTSDQIFATVGGGHDNQALRVGATIAGGSNNAAGTLGTVGGGGGNTAATYAVVPGGQDNHAFGDYSFAAGRHAVADNQGCFVWGDSTDAEIRCSANNLWLARASGGVAFYTNAGMSSGVVVPPGGGSWANLSDRNAKKDVVRIEPRAVLDALEKIPVATWRYKTETSGAKHMGPMAQDFYAAFGLGDSDKTITSVDADGVALAAVQGVHALAKAEHARVDRLNADVAALRKDNAALRHDNDELRERLERLEQRLPALPGYRAAGMAGGLFALLGLALLLGRRQRSVA